jgi:hypothetical protein
MWSKLATCRNGIGRDLECVSIKSRAIQPECTQCLSCVAQQATENEVGAAILRGSTISNALKFASGVGRSFRIDIAIAG